MISMLKKRYLMNIMNLNLMRDRITGQCAEIDGTAHLFHRVHVNLAKHIKLRIENDRNNVENFIYQNKN